MVEKRVEYRNALTGIPDGKELLTMGGACSSRLECSRQEGKSHRLHGKERVD